MIKSLKDKTKIEIDLTSPEGNAFSLIKFAKDTATTLNNRLGKEHINVDELITDMMSSDYEHIIDLLEKHFGHFIILYR